VRIVLDTNVLVSGIFWQGIPYEILEYWMYGKYQMLISDAILNEYKEILYRISNNKSDHLVSSWILFIIENGILIDVKKNFQFSTDPDDNKFIDCAVSGNAEFIISGDSHLLKLKTIYNISIVKPLDFIKKYKMQI
jgi:uncharacterized protein